MCRLQQFQFAPRGPISCLVQPKPSTPHLTRYARAALDDHHVRNCPDEAVWVLRPRNAAGPGSSLTSSPHAGLVFPNHALAFHPTDDDSQSGGIRAVLLNAGVQTSIKEIFQ